MKTLPALVVLLLSMKAAAADPLPPPATGTSVASPSTATRAQPSVAFEPIRARRMFALAGELGWNSLSGGGVNLIVRPLSRLALDLGAGISGVGYKAGARARLNLLHSSWTPTLGVGAVFGSGTLGQNVNLNDVSFRLEPSTFVQAVAGAEYCGSSGLTFLATFGYAHLLGENIELVAGAPTPQEKQAMELAYHGGLVLSVALGYSF